MEGVFSAFFRKNFKLPAINSRRSSNPQKKVLNRKETKRKIDMVFIIENLSQLSIKNRALCMAMILKACREKEAKVILMCHYGERKKWRILDNSANTLAISEFYWKNDNERLLTHFKNRFGVLLKEKKIVI